MIRWEVESTSKIQLQIGDMKKLFDNYVKAYNDKFKNHQEMITHLRSRLEAKEFITHKLGDGKKL